MHGSCLCGRVRFEVLEPFAVIGLCHCTNCKKVSGAGAITGGMVRTAAIRITDGADALRAYRPVEGLPKAFCGECGSNLFGGGWPDGEYSAIRLTAIDSRFNGGPQLHKYVQSLAPWETIPDDGLPRFERNPDADATAAILAGLPFAES